MTFNFNTGDNTGDRSLLFKHGGSQTEYGRFEGGNGAFIGNFGIATDTPSHKLTVNGDVLFNGDLTLDNGTTTVQACVGCLNDNYEQITGSTGTWGGASALLSDTADCTAGKKVIGGGYSISDIENGNMFSSVSRATDDDTWTATGYCGAGAACNGRTITAYAICILP